MKIILTILALFIIGCKKKEKYSEVRKTLEKVLIEDQKFRNPYIPEKQNAIDRNNTKIVTKIIDSLGWLGKDDIGYDANLALFMVIQHTDKLSTMEKYLTIMKEEKNSNKVDKRQIAYLTDRVELLNDRKQIYGTQYSIDKNGIKFIDNLINPEKVNERRKSMGMEPVEEYLMVLNEND